MHLQFSPWTVFVCCTNWVDLGVPDERPHHNHGNLTLAILSVASFLLDRVSFSQDPNHPNLARLCQYLDQVVLPKEDKVLMAPSWWSQLRQCPGTGRPLGGWKQGGCGSLDRPPTGVPTPPTSPTHHVHQPAHKLPTMPNISDKPLFNHLSKPSSEIYFEQI